ncbi:isochorismate synthase [Companilactobacillus mishanensis]|uniref:isochorismate synthase n=1 Tax=Companilactobacillus mishanensis TaxID=2486008 RepID=UPI0012981E3A|nr:isochorismate synthase [Companilactobacillus mishanensis]MQS88415.1 isochorismate synthase [Companilactobacillus mishanensis]
MLNVRQIRVNWSKDKLQKLIDAAVNQEIFSFFESSDEQTKWIGIGSTSRINPDSVQNSFDVVRDWFLNIQKQLPKKTDLNSIAVIGGFSFYQFSEKSKFWQNWSGGVFVLPRIIIKISNDKVVISEIREHGFSGDKLEDALDKIMRFDGSSSTLRSFTKRNDSPDWAKTVDELAGKISQDEILKKVVLGRFSEGILDGQIDSNKLLKGLQALNRNTYHFILKIKDQMFVSATPERLFKLEDEDFSTAAVAGTIKRGDSQLSDDKLSLELYKDEKNRAEHSIVATEILSKIKSFSDDIESSKVPMILKNQTVQHLYTPINAKINTDKNVFDLIKIMHPTPALGGFPTKQALELITQLETRKRVMFGAPIGYITLSGNAELIVGIRSMYINKNNFLLFAGAGIMPDSVGSSEFAETELKLQPMLKLLQYLEGK